MITLCAIFFLSSRFSSFTVCLLHQYLSLLPRLPTSLPVCLSFSICLSVPLSLSLSLSLSLTLSLTSYTFFPVYNSLFLSYPVGFSFLSFLVRCFPIIPSLSLSLSLSVSLSLSLSLSLSFSLPPTLVYKL